MHNFKVDILRQQNVGIVIREKSETLRNLKDVREN